MYAVTLVVVNHQKNLFFLLLLLSPNNTIPPTTITPTIPLPQSHSISQFVFATHARWFFELRLLVCQLVQAYVRHSARSDKRVKKLPVPSRNPPPVFVARSCSSIRITTTATIATINNNNTTTTSFFFTTNYYAQHRTPVLRYNQTQQPTSLTINYNRPPLGTSNSPLTRSQLLHTSPNPAETAWWLMDTCS